MNLLTDSCFVTQFTKVFSHQFTNANWDARKFLGMACSQRQVVLPAHLYTFCLLVCATCVWSSQNARVTISQMQNTYESSVHSFKSPYYNIVYYVFKLEYYFVVFHRNCTTDLSFHICTIYTMIYVDNLILHSLLHTFWYCILEPFLTISVIHLLFSLRSCKCSLSVCHMSHYLPSFTITGHFVWVF